MQKDAVQKKRKPTLDSTDQGESMKKQTNPYNGEMYSHNYYKLLKTRQSLPAWEARKLFKKLIKKHQIIVLQGETGSGKTTQIPQFLLEYGYTDNGKQIACTQPRRVAAMSVAKRVSEEMDVQLGQEVGYSIRFDNKTGPKTVLKYLTDGMLIREAISDPSLSRYSVVILDEAHERTLDTDILFGLLKKIQVKRGDDLKVIIMSATMDAEKFQKYFYDAPLLDIPGRLFPVEIYYTPQAEQDYVTAAVRTAVQIHCYEEPGDILMFMTGEDEIENACEAIREEIYNMGDEVGYIDVVPLYSTLPPNMQQMIFNDPPGPNEKGVPGRKCIVSTNIAETSLTIDGISYVIDTGFSKQKVYNPRLRVESLLVSPISKASAKQRAGRAGRTKEGKTYRLYTEASYKNDLIDNTYPEILRSNLAGVVLSQKKLGIDDLVHFDFMDPPAPETMMRALELLNYLGALDNDGDLTDDGVLMAELPLDPQLGKMLIASAKYECTEQILSIVAMLSVPYAFVRPRDKQKAADDAGRAFGHRDGDHLSQQNAYDAYIKNGKNKHWCINNFISQRNMSSADNIRSQLQRMLVKNGFEMQSIDKTDKKFSMKIRKTILSGYFTQIAHLQKNGNYIIIKDNTTVAVHPSSLMKNKPSFILYHDFVLTSKNFIRIVCQVDGEWLYEIAHPEYFKAKDIKNPETKKELLEIEYAIKNF